MREQAGPPSWCGDAYRKDDGAMSQRRELAIDDGAHVDTGVRCAALAA